MTPAGPYRSLWTTGDWFLVSTVQGGEICYSVVQNGLQAHEGTVFSTLRASHTFLKENGFTLPKRIA